MNLEEAIKLALQGKAIRAVEWEKDKYYKIKFRMFVSEGEVRSQLWKWKNSQWEEYIL